jgi:hypothetical protein
MLYTRLLTHSAFRFVEAIHRPPGRLAEAHTARLAHLRCRSGAPSLNEAATGPLVDPVLVSSLADPAASPPGLLRERDESRPGTAG